MRLLKSFLYACKGFAVAVREEQNLRIHLLATGIVIALALYYHVSIEEWLILLTLIGLVIGFELFNSAIENLTDLVTKEKIPLAGKVKDIAAAAVLFVSVIALVVGITIFARHINV